MEVSSNAENPKKTKDDIVQWIRDYFAENGPDCSAVVGISGGKDSTIVAPCASKRWVRTGFSV